MDQQVNKGDNPPAYKDVVVLSICHEQQDHPSKPEAVKQHQEDIFIDFKLHQDEKSEDMDQFCVCVLVVLILESILIICLLPILYEIIW